MPIYDRYIINLGLSIYLAEPDKHFLQLMVLGINTALLLQTIFWVSYRDVPRVGGGVTSPHPTRIVELYFFQIFQNFGLIISKKSWNTWQKLEKLEEKKC